jgi:AraC-like DNA-binding protein
MELVIDLRENTIPILDHDSQLPCGTTKGARICGVHSQGFIIDKERNCSVIGAHFRPGGNAAFFPIPARELHNQIISLEELWPGRATELRDRLIEQPTPETQLLTLEHFLLSMMQPPASHPAITFALGAFERSQTTPVSTVACQTGFSPRHFNRLFCDQVGLKPKLYCRIRRLQYVLRLLEGQEQIDWLDVAFAAGYFDQAHLIHEFRTLADCTPTEYLAKRDIHPSHVELLS